MGVEFVGRRAELATLARALSPVGATRVVRVEGAPGIGKSTLVAEAVSALPPPSAVISVAPTSAERRTPWGAVRLLLSSGLIDLAAAHQAPVQPILLDVCGLAAGDATTDGSDVLVSDSDAGQATFAFAALVERLSTSVRLVIVIDDVQWVDPASAGAIAVAMRTSGDWIVAQRAGEPASLDVRRLVSPDQLVELALSPMDRHELDLLARAETGRPWNPVELALLGSLSEGNPLHARELLRAYPGPGALGDARVPTGLEDLFGERVARLDRDAFEVVALLALMPRPDLATLFDLCDSATAETALRSAEQLGLVRVSGTGVDFDHAMTRRAVVDRVGGVERVQLHRRLAEVTDDPIAKAWHLGQGALGADHTVAEVLETTGRALYEQGDSTSAADLLARAVELTPKSDDIARRRRACRAGTAAADAGDWSRAHQLLVDVVAEAGNAPEAIAGRNSYVVAVNRLFGTKPTIDAIETLLPIVDEPTERAELLAKLVRLTMFGDLEAARRVAERALAHAEQVGGDRLLMRARLGLDQISVFLGLAVDPTPYLADLDRLSFAEIGYTARACIEEITEFLDMHDVARRLSTETYELGISTGSTADVHNGLNRLVGIERRSGNWRRAREVAAEYTAMAVGHNGELPGHPSAEELWIMAATGDHAAIPSSVPLVVADADEAFPIGRYPVLCDAGFALLAVGDFGGAVELLRAAQTTADELHVRDLRAADYHVNLIEALLHLGRVAEADETATDAEEIAALGDSRFARFEAARARSLVLVATGAYGRAVDVLDPVLVDAEQLRRPFEHGRALLTYGGALRRSGARTRAREVLDRAESVLTEIGAMPWVDRVAVERELLGGRAPRADPNALSAAEQQVAELVLAGLSNQAVADELFVSVRTVESHLTRIYRKLRVKSRSQLLARGLP